MTEVLTRFPPTRFAALERLSAFLPHAGRAYAARRNYDLGRDAHLGVSTLSPYIRARLITEREVLNSVLAKHSSAAADKFIQEVFWRTYWKGWLEMRPTVWTQYQNDLQHHLNAVQTQSGLRSAWEAACTGQTDIACFDHWARELVETGYLHNHARMWFASIWIFTLRLPWQLGADFFLRHLLDGDPASNTLSWRWVAGLHTAGKTYLARKDNIAKYTEGRFTVHDTLSPQATPVAGTPNPERSALPPVEDVAHQGRTGLLLHDDDLSPGYILDAGHAPIATAFISTRAGLSPLHVAQHVADFTTGAMQDTVSRFGSRLGDVTTMTFCSKAIAQWAETNNLSQIITPYAPVGPAASLINAADTDVPIRRLRRAYDDMTWPHATHGFFKFKDKIPQFLAAL